MKVGAIKEVPMTLPEPKYQVQLLEEDDKHFYLVNGRKLCGVTNTLEIVGGNKTNALMGWATKTALERVQKALEGKVNGSGSKVIVLDKKWIAEVLAEARKQPKKLKDEAADYGTQAHLIFDAIFKGQPYTVPEPLTDTVKAFKDWLSATKLKVIAGDTKVASLEHGYGGSLDFLAYQDGKYILGDMKTSGGIRDTYALQVGAYAQALWETYGIKVERGVIVRVDKKPPYSFEVKEVRCIWTAFESFLHAKRLAEAMQQEMYLTEDA